MWIKSNLVYNKSTGRLVGFTEMGSINDEYWKFQGSVESQKSDNKQHRMGVCQLCFGLYG